MHPLLMSSTNHLLLRFILASKSSFMVDIQMIIVSKNHIWSICTSSR